MFDVKVTSLLHFTLGIEQLLELLEKSDLRKPDPELIEG